MSSFLSHIMNLQRYFLNTLVLAFGLTSALADTLTIGDLRCEYQTAPLAIDAAQPHLSWKLESEALGQKQTAYQVLVASSAQRLSANQGDLWDTGKVETDQSILITYQGRTLESQRRCHWKVRVWDKDGRPSPWSAPAEWTMGLLKPEDWQARWIQWIPPSSAAGKDGTDSLCPWLRKSFNLKAAPERALVRLNVSGYAELYINGQKAGRDVLTPAISNLEQRSFYVTYDVSKLLRQGSNTIAVWLGRGWADGVPSVRAQLDASVAGQSFVLGTNATWKGRKSSYQYLGSWKWNNFGGERFDAREQLEGWNQPGECDDSWSFVTEIPNPRGAVVAQPTPLNRIGAEIPAVAVTELERGQYLIDFGTALTGWLRMKMPALPAGSVVKLSFADARNADAKRGKDGFQTFKQISEFVANGQAGQVFENKFSYAGFRYVIVEGLLDAPQKSDATALLVESDLEATGFFECSNERLNRIHKLTQWTQRCLNLGGYYVDCPTRERLGYGDGQVAAEGFMTSFQAAGFYRKWLADWRLRQEPDGKMPNVAPTMKGGGGPGWAGVLAAITWRHYLYYGDRRVIEENYEAIRRYVGWLERKCQDDVLRKYGGKWDFIGDWVAPGRGMDTNNWPDTSAAELFNNCYRVYQWELLANMAAVMDDQKEIARCAARLASMRPAIHQAFYDPTNARYVIDEQAYYVMPLMTGVAPESARPALLRNLEQNILSKNHGHLDTGMLGTYFMMEYLREIGRSDLVFTMFNQTTYPSWGYMLEQGATTAWEQWNGYFSHIHSCFTSANNWLYQGPGGIRPDPTGAGFKKIIIQPAIVGDLTWVKAHFDSPYGRIVSNWNRDGSKLTMNVTIPVNTTATVFVPNEVPREVKSGKHTFITQLKQEKEGKL